VGLGYLHNLDVIRAADWIIDPGSEGGDKCGYVVATGTPERIAKVDASWTGTNQSRDRCSRRIVEDRSLSVSGTTHRIVNLTALAVASAPNEHAIDVSPAPARVFGNSMLT
jgi:hypothetical protein